MAQNQYRVALVVDPHFGERLNDLAEHIHVWACNSTANRAIVDSLWKENRSYSPSSGVTVFEAASGASPEDMCVRIMEPIDLHHGEYSHDPPWSVLEVYGTGLTPKLEALLRGYGVDSFQPIEGGFIASRKTDTITT